MRLSDEVPNFDPQNGNESARILFVLEAPGAKAVRLIRAVMAQIIEEENEIKTSNIFIQICRASAQ